MLATGLVVDDAIVVMENIYAKVEAGQNRVQAAFAGSREIFFAVISTTVTLVAVFLPVIFLEGLTGRLFREFGVVVVGSVVISSFVSLSLTPMMSSRILKKSAPKSNLGARIGKWLEDVGKRYENSLRSFISRRKITFGLILFSVALIFGLGSLLDSELAPLEDKGRLRILATAPEGTSYEMMDSYVAEIVALTDTIPEKRSLIAVTSPGFGSSNSTNSGFVRLVLKPIGEREKSQMELAAELNIKLREYNFARAFVSQDQTIQVGGGGGRSLPVQFVVQAATIEKLKEIIPEFLERANQDPNLESVDLDLKFNKPELKIEINREKAREMGVAVSDIAQTLQLLYSGQRFGYFIMNGKQYFVIGEAMRTARDEPADLKRVTVRNQTGEQVQIDNLVTTSYESSPPQLYRYDRYAAATFSASPAPGVSLGRAIDAMKSIADDVLDDTYSTSLAGDSKEFNESSGSLFFAFLLALIDRLPLVSKSLRTFGMM